MRIVNACVSGPVTDGLSYQDNLITKYQKKNGNDVVIVTSEWIWKTSGKMGKDPRHDYINEDGVRVIRLPILGKDDFNRKFKKFDRLYETIEQLHPDILFIHGVSCYSDDVYAKYLKNHPEVIAYADNHADFSNSATNWLSKNIQHKIIWGYHARKLVPYVKKFYGVLPARVDFLTDVYGIPKEKCELLVMGADDELVEKERHTEARAAVREKYNIAKDDFLIVTGGKIDQWKTQTLLLMEAVQKIESRKVKLIVFGSVVDELKEKVNNLADGEKVQYIGWQQSADSYPLFAASDLAVFPGRHSVFWEQVAGQGIPMLVKDWPGTHHVDLGGNVEFLIRDSSDEIKQKIEELVENPEKYKKMKDVAEEKGMRVFSYRNIARRAIEE
jgi:1,2-diacylglycerol 3-alpha-glucosyltransferase